MRPGPVLTRRTALQAAAVGLLGSACTWQSGSSAEPAVRSTEPTGPTADPSPGEPGADPATEDVAQVLIAVAEEERLLRYCQALARRHGSLAAEAGVIAGRVRRHARQLRAVVPGTEPGRPGRIPRVPGRPPAARAALADLCAAARDARFADCLAAQSGLLARLFASTAASHALTVEALTR